MEILIDEAGNFSVIGARSNSWCVSAAYVSPETEKRKYIKYLRELKLAQEKSIFEEFKFNEFSENNYFIFLDKLSKLKGVVFCVATDSSLNLEGLVLEHKKNLASSIMDNYDLMKYESGKKALLYLTSQLEKLSTQLYIQLNCQIHLMYSFIVRGIPYFVQRNPNILKKFRWRIDQKEPHKKTDFENAFEKFSPALLQSMSISNPAIALKWCDYKAMSKFIYKEGELPEYLVESVPELQDATGFNIQKIVRDDIKFLDSKSLDGIQVADLIASGIRRCLRNEFDDNDTAAKLIGRLMVQAENNKSPIELLTFGNEVTLNGETSKMIKIMIKACHLMIKKS